MSDVVIKVEDVSKQYRLGKIGTGSLRHDLNRWWHLMRGKEDPYLKIGEVNDRTKKGESDYVWALKDINFEVKRGEVLGIIGRNGAGKSTLLKILSRTTLPTTGEIKTRGRIASLLEVGTGFHPELTGRENIFLNGAILGMRKLEIQRKLDEIIDFSGVERYIDTPVKRYSSGMYVRLAFAVAAYLESEILIVDEVLAVGDAEFQKKCLGKMGEVSKGEGRTVLFVSHNMGAIKQLCTEILALNSGFISSRTFSVNQMDYVGLTLGNNSNYISPNKKLGIDISFSNINIFDEHGNQKGSFLWSQPILINFQFHSNIDILENKDWRLFCVINDSFGSPVFSAESDLIKSTELTLEVKSKFLVKGYYSITAFIHKPTIIQIDRVDFACEFQIIDFDSPFIIHGNFNHGRVFGNYKWLKVND